MITLAVLVATTLAGLSCVHVYWAAGGRWGHGATVPERQGRPSFRPGRVATLFVAGLLGTASVLVLGRVGLGPAAPPITLTRLGTWLVAAAFWLRAVGDFRLVGVFRRERGTRFARWDRRIYTPLAFALALGTTVIAAGTAAAPALLAGSSGSSRAEPDWLIVPGQRAGAIHRTSDEAQLVEAYGRGAVQPIRVELGEGETAPGTVLFAGDSLRRVEVLWHDTVAHAHPARLVLRGRQSHWHLPAGISLGTSLRELEQRNGRAFTLTGFGWDYGGAIVNWAEGALAAQLPGVQLYLDPGPAQYSTPTYHEVLGDRDYSSGSPAMQALDPQVYQIFVDLE
jgi:hypothetical protein